MFIDGLKHNLLSISQLCDMGNKVTFYPKNCFVSSLDKDKVIFWIESDLISHII